MATGELRRTRSAATKKKHGRAKATNKVLFLRGIAPGSSKARRFRDLVRAHLDGIEAPDAGAIATARAAALTTLRIEALQATIINGEDIDDARFSSLTEALGRSLRALSALKEKAQAKQAKAQATSAPSGPEALWEHLRKVHGVGVARPQRGTGGPGADTPSAK
jgi:hypothetical protein